MFTDKLDCYIFTLREGVKSCVTHTTLILLKVSHRRAFKVKYQPI